jgi:hypothetical protein
LRAGDYRPAPEPDVFALNTKREGIEEARKLAVQDMEDAYSENDDTLRTRQSRLTWALILTVVAIITSLVIQSTAERETVPETKQTTTVKKTAKKAWGPPNSVLSYKIGRTLHEVRLGADGRPVPGSMIGRSPSVLGFGKRHRV